MAGNKLLTVLTIIFICITVISNYLIIAKTNEITGKAAIVAGKTRLCINNAPTLIFPCTNNTLLEDDAFSCQLFGSDLDNDTLTFSSTFLTSPTVFTISTAGLISFTPNQSHVGSHSVNITMSDGKGCPDSIDEYIWNFSVINVNDPPYLIRNIPDQNITYGVVLSGFYLDNYFNDSDGDVLTYSVSSTSNIQISIQGNSEVLFTGITCPSTEYVIFTATDPYNLSADSNVVTLTCTLPSEEEEPGEETPGGGGGGGGGRSVRTGCKPNLECEEWGPCMADGIQKKKCVDLNKCREGSFYIERTCTFVPECFNNIQDYYEEGVDCGGPCPPCPTCTDAIQNQDEEGIDCGGPCPPCNFSTLLYASFEDELWDLVYYEQTQETKQNIVEDTANMPEASFSFNGFLVYYTHKNNIWSINRNFDGPEIIDTKAVGEKHRPVVSKDETELAYTTERQGLSFLNMLSLEFFVERTLDLPVSAYHLDWSKDGRFIVFSTKEFPLDYIFTSLEKGLAGVTGAAILEERSMVYVVDSRGNIIKELSDRKYDMYAPRLSPDGQYLTYFTLEEDNADVWIIKLDGTYKRRIVNSEYNELFPVWSDDGKQIIFAADYKGNYDLYAADIDGSNIVEVLSDETVKIPLDNFVYPSCYDEVMNQGETGVDCGGPCDICPSCYDGVKNGDETGIDCGGSCPPCYLEVPGFLPGLSLWAKILAFIILLIVILIILFKVFHRQLRRAWARLEFSMHKKRKKLILLDDESKKLLLEEIMELEKKFRKRTYKQHVGDFHRIAHKYYSSILKLKVLSKSEVYKHLRKIVYKELIEILKSYYDKATHIGKDVGFYELARLTEEIREIVLLTSKHYKSDVLREIIKPKIEKGMSQLEKINVLIADAILAMEFEETEIAERRYLEILRLYDSLKEKEKTLIYGEINRLYLEIRYALSLI